MTSELPILASKLMVPRIIKAYCNNGKCKTIRDHIIYAKYSDELYIKCVACGEKDIHVGKAIVAFETMYCPNCKRETLWVLYCRYSDEIYFKCVGCGLSRFAGRRCPVEL